MRCWTSCGLTVARASQSASLPGAQTGHPAGGGNSGAAALTVRGLSKSFLERRVLQSVDLIIEPGEVHALLGENGAGKSTLIKILAGIHPADEGEIYVGDQLLGRRHSAADASAAGLQFVHQDLGLIDDLDVAENIALTSGFVTRSGIISRCQTRRRARCVLSLLGLSIAPSTSVRELAQVDKVMVAVARAFAQDASVICLDEVTASLPTPEVRRLEDLLIEAKGHGTSFIFVTHRLGEVFNMADRVTVLRDGRRVATEQTRRLTHRQLVKSLVGREIAALPARSAQQARVDNIPVFRVEGLRATDHHEPISFDIAPGEVVAFTGLIGSGAREIVQAVVGAIAPPAGTATLNGTSFALGAPIKSSARGCRYASGDRTEVVAPDLTVRENFFLSHLDEAGTWRRPRRERRRAVALANEYGVRPEDSTELPVSSLSGGNQQKVVIGRALSSDPGLLVLDDPTVGVDVGARVTIHELVRRAADAGVPVLLASSDFPEVASEATRAYVLREGAVGAVLEGESLTEQRLVDESYRPGEKAS